MNGILSFATVVAFAGLASASPVSGLTATYSAQRATLTILGDQADDWIVVSRTARGLILINGGGVHVTGGIPTTWNTKSIEVYAGGGDDSVGADERNGRLPPFFVSGGEGNDILIGGDGNDVLFGDRGNDQLIGRRGNDFVFGEGGNDLIVWNAGDGDDTCDGGAGDDLAEVRGSRRADQFRVDPNGERIRVRCGDCGFVLNLGTIENLDVNGQGGNDVIIGSVGLNGLVNLDLDGGEGNDLLIGGDGVDVLRGGVGNDTLLGNRGNDIVLGQDGNDLLIWNNGDGSDFMEGGVGNDLVRVDVKSTAPRGFSIDPNGERVIFRWASLGLFTLDIGTTENLRVRSNRGQRTVRL